MINKNTVIQPASILQILGSLTQESYGIVTDSRKVEGDKIFIPLRGERFDAHQFIPEILERRLTNLVVVCDIKSVSSSLLEEWQQSYSQTTFICVSDTERYLAELAQAHKNSWKANNPNARIIGITGSNGKTTTKEMLAFTLKKLLGEDRVLATTGNLNNNIGVPQTLLRVTNEEIAIIEMGTNHPGEIPYLLSIVKPDYGIVTSIGKSHLEFFHTIDNVFLEKRTLIDDVLSRENGFVSMNYDDPFLAKIKPHAFMYKAFTEREDPNCYHVRYEDHRITFTINQISKTISNSSVIGKYNFSNMMNAYIIAHQMFPERETEIISALESFIPGLGRSQWCEKNGKKIFSDAYNANPSSMAGALEAFTDKMLSLNVLKQKIQVIVADMNELGASSIEEHIQIGALIKKLSILNPIFIGRFAAEYKKGFEGECQLFSSTDEFLSNGKLPLKDKEFIFIKGSRTLQLERILDISI